MTDYQTAMITMMCVTLIGCVTLVLAARRKSAFFTGFAYTFIIIGLWGQFSIEKPKRPMAYDCKPRAVAQVSTNTYIWRADCEF